MDEVDLSDPQSFAKGLSILQEYAGGFRDVLPEETMYTDPMNKFDGRPELLEAFKEKTGLDLSKAQTITGAASGTTDKALIPLYVDPSIVDVTRRLTPLVELIPRVTNYGRTAEFNRITARGVVGARFEDAALSEQNDTYERKSVPIKYFYSVGRVTGPFMSASRKYLSQQYIDGLNLEIRQKTISLRYVEEDTIINGDVDAERTSAYGGVTVPLGAEYDGFRNYITTNYTDKSGINLSIPLLRALILAARTAGNSTTLGQGDPNLLLTDYNLLDTMKGLLQDFQRYVNSNYEIAWGLKTLEFEGLPVIASKFMPTDTSDRDVICLSMDTWQMRVLQDLTYEDLARTNDSYKFMVKVYECLIGTAQEYNSLYYDFV